MAKVALITGITGQDGSFLAEFLIEKGYEVHGIMRRSSSFNTGRIEHLYLDEWVRDMKNKRLVNLHWGDMTDSSDIDLRIDKGNIKGFQLAGLLLDLEDSLGRPVDLIPTTSLDQRFLDSIRDDEVLLYEAS